MPQPVSGQPSSSTLSRSQLAKREAALRDPGPFRPARSDAGGHGRLLAFRTKTLCQGPLMSAGSFCPSPCMVAMAGKRAAQTPVLSAVLCPALRPMPEIAQSRVFAEQRLDFGGRPIVAGVGDRDELLSAQ